MTITQRRATGTLPAGTEDEGGLSMPVMGTVLFIASEVMFFSTLFATYFMLRSVAAPGAWGPPQGAHVEAFLPLILTFILLTSSVAMHGSIWGIRNDNRSVFVSGLAITVLLGILFVCGEMYDAVSSGFSFHSNAYGSIFFTILTFHGLHVLGGVIFIGYALFGALNGAFSRHNYQVIESASYYWHFVDIVWLFVFSILYLIK